MAMNAQPVLPNHPHPRTDIPMLSPTDLTLLLSFASRLLALEVNADIVCERALEALSDFSGNGNCALFLHREHDPHLHLEGVFTDKIFQPLKAAVAYAGTPITQILLDKEGGYFPLSTVHSFPWPARETHPLGHLCLCLPLAGSANKIIGFVAVVPPRGEHLTAYDQQLIRVLTSLIAISLENVRLFSLATVDALTGLFVRHFFEIRLEEEMASIRRYGGSLAVLLLDVDNLKQVNDTRGHPAGDLVLKDLARIIRNNIRQSIDVPARYGGDEFILLIHRAGREEAMHLARRITTQCAGKTIATDEGPVKVTISCGLAVLDAGESANIQPADLVKQADQMLYRAKMTGRNQICCRETA